MTDPLATGFESVSEEAWSAKARGDRDLDPVTPVEDGINAKWLYTPADALGEDPAGLPGQAPFVRGTRAGRHWQIRQEQAAPGREQANREILEDLNGGVTELTLRIDRAARAGLAPSDPTFAEARGADGIAISTLDDLDRTLDGVYLDLAGVALEAGSSSESAAALLAALWRQRGIAPELARGSFRIDPLGTLAREGHLPLSGEDALTRAAGIAAETARDWPAARALAIDTGIYVEAGASAAWELGLAIAGAVEFIRAGERAGTDPETIATQLEFTLAVGTDQFLEMAKFRAIRRLWARVLEACGVAPESRSSATYARTSARSLTAVDPWVNMLRATTAVFAAGTGGADGVTVTPFDREIGQPDDLGRRIARNTQIILQDESSLGRIADPLAGSWYGESLTDDLARAGWDRFREIERAGGALAALRSGLIAESLATLADGRADDLDHRRRVMTGINEFPLLGDDGTTPKAPDRGAVAGDAERLAALPEVPGLDRLGSVGPDQLLGTATSLATAGVRIDQLAAALAGEEFRVEPLGIRPDAEPFEEFRRATSEYVTAGGEPPRIYLATMGRIASHVALANWARSFFEVAGIEAVPGGAVESNGDHATLLKEGGFRLAAVCAGKEQVAEDVADLVTRLREAGAEWIYMINSAPELNEAALAAGADELVRNGVSMNEVLTAALGRLGVEVAP
ncbi:MAG: methylmalonyl-CoA mutase family protein [Solirubrobacterales bacterium]|nr:methylmalonyl-CoA mutase family protein [Solirubrobacterales bacterium]